MVRLGKVCLIAALLAAVILPGTLAGGRVRSARADAAEQENLLYRLTFEEGNIGKNVAETEFADATLQPSNSLTVAEGPKGGKALNFPGDTKMVNYLSLPHEMFKGQTAVTFAGWFYVPSGVEAYLGEFGIASESNKAYFRADPLATSHNGNYMFCVGDKDKGNENAFPVDDDASGNGLRAVYDGWYHMAYVIDGANHTFTVYQNGIKAHERELKETDFTPAEFDAEDARFYLGQSSYEDTHNDYKGKMSDIRVYGGALTGEQIKAAYDLNITDFMTAEYTFDTDGSDSSGRGYDLHEFNGSPVYEDGVMKLSGGAAAQAYKKDEVNPNFFCGHRALTVSMDINIHTEPSVDWRRIMDLYAGENNRITFMAFCPRAGKFFDAVYAHNGDNNMLSDNSFTPKTNETFNLTVVLSDKTITVWEDGVLKVTGTCGDKPDFASFLYDLSGAGAGNFTIGTCSYEPNNYLEADYDNIRVYAVAAETADEVRAARMGYESYTVTYHANNGTEEKQEKLCRAGADYTVEDNLFSYDGYRFTGWNTTAKGDGTPRAAKESFKLEGAVDLYAQWEKNSHTVTFHENGGRGTMEEQIVLFGSSANLNECGFARTGYTFAGWATEETGSVIYQDGAQLPELHGDLELWAVWTAKQYTVTFDQNGGEGTMSEQELTFGTAENLTENAYTRHGYTFAGWALTETGVAVYSDGEQVTGIGEGDDVTLYAVWTIGTFRVTFHSGGTGAMSAQTGEAFSYLTLKKNGYSYDGKQFIGWAEEEGGDVVYQDGEQIVLDDDIELWAVWQDNAPVDPGDDDPDNPDDPDDPGDDDPQDPEPSGGPRNRGLIIGLTVGGAAVVSAAAAAVIVILKKRRM